MFGVTQRSGVEDCDTEPSAAAALDPAQFVSQERSAPRGTEFALKNPKVADGGHDAGGHFTPVHPFDFPPNIQAIMRNGYRSANDQNLGETIEKLSLIENVESIVLVSMAKSHLPLNALRAFEAAARHLSFTKAGLELRVTQAAVSHLVKSLEATLGSPLFRRVPRGLALTDEGLALLPAVSEAFGQLRSAVDAFRKGADPRDRDRRCRRHFRRRAGCFRGCRNFTKTIHTSICEFSPTTIASILRERAWILPFALATVYGTEPKPRICSALRCHHCAPPRSANGCARSTHWPQKYCYAPIATKNGDAGLRLRIRRVRLFVVRSSTLRL